MSQRNALILFALLLIAGAAVFFLNRSASSPSDDERSEDPFAYLSIPSDVDDATRAIFEEKVSGTRALYAELPDDGETWIAIGNLYQLFNDPVRAIEIYKTSLDLNPTNILGFRNIAEVYRLDLGEYEKAQEYYRLAINQNFSEPELYWTLALMQHKQLGKVQEAEQTYLDGLSKTDNEPALYARLIEFYLNTGQKEKYEAAIRRLLELYPNNKEIQEHWRKVLENVQ